MTKSKNAAAAELGRLGGLARAQKIKAGILAPSGGIKPVPSTCPKCGILCPSVRALARHRKEHRNA